MARLGRFVLALLLAGALSSTASADLVLQFTRGIGTIIGSDGSAAVGFDGTNIWVAKWATGEISRITPAGVLVDTFTVPGLTGTRSLTWDGSQMWSGNATTTLRRIDPVSLLVTSTLMAPTVARYISYDPTADSGAGGFWIGDFNTDIELINMTGATLRTLPTSGFPGFTGKYGIAFDNVSGPAPFLWVFYQGGAMQCELGIIDISNGAARPATQDLSMGLAGPPLAGGLFLTSGVVPGQNSLLAVVQSTPNVLIGLQPASSVPVQLQQFNVD